MRTSRRTDFRSRDIAKNNFSGIDISQGLDLEFPSQSPYFLLQKSITPLFALMFTCNNIKIQIRNKGRDILVFSPQLGFLQMLDV